MCDRARMWASLRLDGELSELEGALLDAHLGRCDECSATVATFAATARALRAEPHLATSVAMPRRSRSMRTFVAATAATLLVTFALAGAGFVGAFHAVSGGSGEPRLVRVSAVAGAADDVQLLLKARPLRPHTIANRLLWPV